MKVARLGLCVLALSATAGTCRSKDRPIVLRFDPSDPPGITYPKLARSVPYRCPQENGPTTVVWFTVSVDTDGSLSHVKVRGPWPGEKDQTKVTRFFCENEAIAAIEQWRLTPALKDGKPIPVVGAVGLVMPIDDSR